jgi:acyl-CoA reductase-like NAD-dependent aldehyde dehydrogenase
MSYQSINPFNGELVKSFEEHSDEQLETAIATASTCFESWGKMHFSERATTVSRAAAIALANDSDYGLGGSVFTQDIERGKRIASRIETGMVFVNHPTWTDSDLPFGGIKNSGYGRELSSHGIHEFVNKKLVRVASINAPA